MRTPTATSRTIDTLKDYAEKARRPLLALSILVGASACGEAVPAAPNVVVTASQLGGIACDTSDESTYEVTALVAQVDHSSQTEMKVVYDLLADDFDTAFVERHTYDMLLVDAAGENDGARVVHVDSGGFVSAFPGPIKPNGVTKFAGETVTFEVEPREFADECVYMRTN